MIIKKYSNNSSGIYFDLLLLSDDTIIEINNIVSTYFSETESDVNQNINYITYTTDDKVEMIQGE